MPKTHVDLCETTYGTFAAKVREQVHLETYSEEIAQTLTADEWLELIPRAPVRPYREP